MGFKEITQELKENPWDLFYRLSKSEAQRIFTEAIYALQDNETYEDFVDSIAEFYDDAQSEISDQ